MRRNQQSSRERLLQAAHALFAERGYEFTTSAAIARAAKTSQSQFIKHFGDKPGVLAAIYQQAWGEIVSAVGLAVDRMSAPRDKLKLLVDIVLSYLARHREFRRIVLAASPCVSNPQRVATADSAYAEFLCVVDGILEQARSAGELLANVPVPMLRSALMGALFGMLADLDHQRSSGAATSYSESEVAALLSKFMLSYAATRVPAADLAESEPSEVTWVSNYLNLASKLLGPSGSA